MGESFAVRDNPAQSRFELDLDGSMALAEYTLDDGVMTFTHTETPPARQGRGAASKLIHGALLAARARGLKVRATCSFVVAYLARHPEFADLTPSSDPR
ncbi:GNAT family N-acetyltransferase [Methylocystis sp. JR02]|uniref:GNAT family N-acetyltransferase n=1 Tax=Methylocystis sp. JR02 TaxID=3046284 RepID=UPI0024BBA9D3|nr:GNAT family N-acetyltransferase [Methylocystis sp. JR02]MDJ0447701.1 GNAT family N-acetyltransferase [Methylocystis sp. JR02]